MWLQIEDDSDKKKYSVMTEKISFSKKKIMQQTGKHDAICQLSCCGKSNKMMQEFYIIY